jgi:hypothetical protein
MRDRGRADDLAEPGARVAVERREDLAAHSRHPELADVVGDAGHCLVAIGLRPALTMSLCGADRGLRATVLSGQFAPGAQVLKLATIIQGGTRGVGNPSGLSSTSTANSFLEATVQIDPKWIRDNPGYTLVMDSALSPPSAVPEPGCGSLLLAGVAMLLGFGVRRQVN